MLNIKFLGFCFLCVLLSTSLVYGEEKSYVEVLTTSTFATFISENAIVLVEFYAPWCGHCKKLEPEFEKAATELLEKKSLVRLAKVDATAETALADEHKVRGYPTIMLFRNGVPEDYSGGRTTPEILEWIDKMTGDSVMIVEDADAKIKEDQLKIVFVGTFKSKESDAYKTFVQAADASRNFGKFLVMLGDDKTDQIVVKKEEEDAKFDGKMELQLLKTWIKDESFPLLGSINGDNFRSYVDRGLDIVWLCGDAKNFEEFKLSVRMAAKEFKGKYSFVFLDIDLFRGHAEGALGVSSFPSLVYQSKNGRYVFPEPETGLKDSQKVIQFFLDVESGKVEKSLKSEDMPENNDKPVKIVVGKNFKEIVLQENKDVLLEVYAPWCGHCKKLEPIYDELAEKLKEFEDKIVIAKMDGTANESPVEDFDWTGFPTLFFIKAGTKTPMRYEGGRTLEGFMEYIKKNASHKLEKVADKGEEL